MLDVVALGIDLFVGMVMIALPMIVVSWIIDRRRR